MSDDTAREFLQHLAQDEELQRRISSEVTDREAKLLEQETIADFVTVLGGLPLQYEPGSKWHYSVAVDVQGRLVEVLSGMRFGEFLQTRLFRPLNMTDTGFSVPDDKLHRFAALYSPEGTSVGSSIVWQRSESTRLVPASTS